MAVEANACHDAHVEVGRQLEGRQFPPSHHVCPRAQTCRLLPRVLFVCLPWIALYKIFK